MSTDDAPEVAEPILTARQRRAPILLPVDPSDEELARDWTLSDADVAEALRCRGDANRRRFAIQLCVLRKHGRFLGEYAAVPTRVINHLCRQLQLPPVLFVDRAARDATESEHQRRIRDYLGYRGFDAEVQRRLEGWLSDWTAEALLPGDLFERAEALLRSWRVVLPAPSTLERIVVSVASGSRRWGRAPMASRSTCCSTPRGGSCERRPSKPPTRRSWPTTTGSD